MKNILSLMAILVLLAGCVAGSDMGRDERLTAQQTDKAAVLLGLRTMLPVKASYSLRFVKLDPATMEINRNIFGAGVPDDTFEIGHNAIGNQDVSTVVTQYYARVVTPGFYVVSSVFSHDAMLMMQPVLTCISKPNVVEIKAGQVNYVGDFVLGINDRYQATMINRTDESQQAMAAMKDFPGLTVPFAIAAIRPAPKSLLCGGVPEQKK
ncbi:hypothetical protein [Niveispirillum sp. KHB5.9]|uniref:hypothetical protein n=1 Tax=Niveispirillum sp. KHB5.9 TaxID=3400269 RepID=UPI003A899D39